MSLEDVDPTSLGDIIEGQLYKTAKGKWVIRDRNGEHRIEDLLEKYKGEDVRLTFASLQDLAEIADLMKQSQED